MTRLQYAITGASMYKLRVKVAECVTCKQVYTYRNILPVPEL